MLLNVGKVDTKNLIIGGDFSTNPWQRGTSAITIANGITGYTADRFAIQNNCDATVVVQPFATPPTLAQAGQFISTALRIDTTVADTSLTTNQFVYFYQHVEGYNFSSAYGKPLTLSFWVRSAVTGTYSVGLSNSGFDYSNCMEYTVNAANTWEFKTLSFVAPTTGVGTWNFTNGIGLRVFFGIGGWGQFDSRSSGFNTWTSSRNIISTNQASILGTVGNNIMFANIQLEVGSQATPFENRPANIELMLCQRYFAKTFNANQTPAQASGGGNGEIYTLFTSTITFANMTNWYFPVKMRAQPTITTYNPIGSGTGWYRDSDGANISAQVYNSGEHNCGVTNTANSTVQTSHRIHLTASAEL